MGIGFLALLLAVGVVLTIAMLVIRSFRSRRCQTTVARLERMLELLDADGEVKRQLKHQLAKDSRTNRAPMIRRAQASLLFEGRQRISFRIKAYVADPPADTDNSRRPDFIDYRSPTLHIVNGRIDEEDFVKSEVDRACHSLAAMILRNRHTTRSERSRAR